MAIYDKIYSGFYDDKPEEQFVKDLFAECNVIITTDTEKLYWYAYQKSHSAGYNAIASTFLELVDLLKDMHIKI